MNPEQDNQIPTANCPECGFIAKQDELDMFDGFCEGCFNTEQSLNMYDDEEEDETDYLIRTWNRFD